MKSCRSSFCDFGEFLPPNDARRIVLLLVRLAGMSFETAITFSAGEALLWLEAAAELENELAASL